MRMLARKLEHVDQWYFVKCILYAVTVSSVDLLFPFPEDFKRIKTAERLFDDNTDPIPVDWVQFQDRHSFESWPPHKLREATNAPLIELQPLLATNARGDINFGQRTSSASLPAVGDAWFDNTNGRLEFRHASSLTRAISTPFGPNYGPTQQVSIVGTSITVTSGGHFQISGAAFPAADNFDTIVITGAGPKDGDTIMLRMATGSSQITVLTGAGNIRLNAGANVGLNVVNDTLVLMFISATSQWVFCSHGNNPA